MKFATISIAAALAVPSLAHADLFTLESQIGVHVEAAAGVAHYAGSGSGTYYEDGADYQHTLDFTRLGYQVGLTGGIIERSRWGVDWHADYVYLGHESFDGLVDSDDSNYIPQTGSCRAPCAPSMRMLGGGSVSGIAILAEPHFDWHGARLGLLVGPFIYRPTMTLTAFMPDGTVFNAAAKTNIRIAPTIGAQITYRNAFVRYQYFADRSAGGSIPGIQTSTHMLSVGYRF